ncbi:MAG: M48 family metalloprotease [Desulfobacteraceae bacterium]
MVKRTIGAMLFALGLFGMLLWTASCAVNPVSGQRELMLISEKEEIQLGGQTDADVVRQFGIYDDKKLTAYVNDLGQRMGKVSHRPRLAYHFKVLDVSVVNAFAVPGGYVYFTRGILASLNSEAELAGVLGHEIGHITARHSAQQISRAQLAQMGMAAGSLISPEFRALSGLAGMGVQMLFLKFSRDNERQADDLGVEYASKVGYDASQMANFFETLERMNPHSDKSGLPGWFSTHPNPEDREEMVRVRSREWQQRLGQKDPKVGRNAYLRHMDGLVFGEDPRQGYVDEGMFYHPQLRFQFPVPRDWKVNNTPSLVQMAPKQGGAAILLSVTPGTSPRQAAINFAEKSRASVIKYDAKTVNGLSAYRLISDIATQGGVLRVMSYFIAKDNYIYVFHGLSTPQSYEAHARLFERTMSQFRPLTDRNRINVKPDRIRIRTAKRADTMGNVLRSLGVPEKERKEIALLNGKSLNDPIPPNTLIKVVEKGR